MFLIENVIIDRDDLGNYTHDMRRLMALFRIFIDDDLLYIYQKEINANKGAAVFKLMDYTINGRSSKDVAEITILIHLLMIYH